MDRTGTVTVEYLKQLDDGSQVPLKEIGRIVALSGNLLLIDLDCECVPLWKAICTSQGA